MFSSGAHEMLVETTYDCHLHGPECYGCVYEQEWIRYHYPTNPVNRILREFRNTVPVFRKENARYYVEYIDAGAVYDWLLIPKVEQQHARSVLSRLARMEAEDG